MNRLARNKSDLVLAFLFLESLLLSLIVENPFFFWLLFSLITLTVFLYSLIVLEIKWKKILESGEKYDVLFIVFMTVMLNANVTVFANRMILSIILAGYYAGVRFLARMFKNPGVNQVERNAINLSALFTIFLGSNLAANISIILEKTFSDIISLVMNAGIFTLVYLISYYNFSKNKIAAKWSRAYSVVLALVISEVSVLSGFYLERYPSIYKVESTSNMSIVTLPLFLVVVYYMVYGLMIHKLAKRLTGRVLIEYIGISAVILVTLFITIRWFV